MSNVIAWLLVAAGAGGVVGAASWVCRRAARRTVARLQREASGQRFRAEELVVHNTRLESQAIALRRQLCDLHRRNATLAQNLRVLGAEAPERARRIVYLASVVAAEAEEIGRGRDAFDRPTVQVELSQETWRQLKALGLAGSDDAETGRPLPTAASA